MPSETEPARYEIGDVIYMECLPGGICTFLGERRRLDDLYYRVYCAKNMTVMELPDYYFIDLESAIKYYQI